MQIQKADAFALQRGLLKQFMSAAGSSEIPGVVLHARKRSSFSALREISEAPRFACRGRDVSTSGTSVSESRRHPGIAQDLCLNMASGIIQVAQFNQARPFDFAGQEAHGFTLDALPQDAPRSLMESALVKSPDHELHRIISSVLYTKWGSIAFEARTAPPFAFAAGPAVFQLLGVVLVDVFLNGVEHGVGLDADGVDFIRFAVDGDAMVQILSRGREPRQEQGDFHQIPPEKQVAQGYAQQKRRRRHQSDVEVFLQERRIRLPHGEGIDDRKAEGSVINSVDAHSAGRQVDLGCRPDAVKVFKGFAGAFVAAVVDNLSRALRT
ncbi:MAG: hypothetical protein ACLVJ6_14840 [Merdibacter sp.]